MITVTGVQGVTVIFVRRLGAWLHAPGSVQGEAPVRVSLSGCVKGTKASPGSQKCVQKRFLLFVLSLLLHSFRHKLIEVTTCYSIVDLAIVLTI